MIPFWSVNMWLLMSSTALMSLSIMILRVNRKTFTRKMAPLMLVLMGSTCWLAILVAYRTA